MLPGLTLPGAATVVPPIAPPKIVTIGSTYDANLRAIYNAAGHPAPILGDRIVFYINDGAIVGASSTGAWALNVGSWPEGAGDPLRPVINVIIKPGARIQGAGGQGGGSNSGPGLGGGSAFYIGQAINLVTTGAQLWGGGGGGGGAIYTNTYFNGGGGAGSVRGEAGGFSNGGGLQVYSQGQPGSSEGGGAGMSGPGGTCGAGGGPGATGGTANITPLFSNYGGGGPGYSVYGWGNATFGSWDYTLLQFTATGAHGADIRGPIA